MSSCFFSQVFFCGSIGVLGLFCNISSAQAVEKNNGARSWTEKKIMVAVYSDVSEYFFNSKFWVRLNYGNTLRTDRSSLLPLHSSMPSLQSGYTFNNVGLSFGVIPVTALYGALRADKDVSSDSSGTDDPETETAPTKEIDLPRDNKDSWKGLLYEIGVNYFTRLKNFSSITGQGKFSVLKGSLRDGVYNDDLSVTMFGLEAGIFFPLNRKNKYFVGLSLNSFWGYGNSSLFSEPENSVLPLRSVHYNISVLNFL